MKPPPKRDLTDGLYADGPGESSPPPPMPPRAPSSLMVYAGSLTLVNPIVGEYFVGPGPSRTSARDLDERGAGPSESVVVGWERVGAGGREGGMVGRAKARLLVERDHVPLASCTEWSVASTERSESMEEGAAEHVTRGE